MQLSSLLLAGTAMAAVVFAQDGKPNINTPNPLIQCQNYQITFSGGSPPYNLYATKEGQFGAILAQIGSGVTGTSYTWKVNLASGTAINLFITDNAGQSNTSGGATILSSNDSSCLGTANTSSAASGGASSTGSSSPSSTSGASSSSRSTTAGGSSNTAATRSSSTGGASQTSQGSGNGASQLTGFSAAVAGAVGVVVAALV
jgi:hypothetical protein